MIATCFGLIVFVFLAASFGHRLINSFVKQSNSDGEYLLYCVGAGVISIQLLIMPALFTNHIRVVLIVVGAFVFLVGMNRFSMISKMASGTLLRILKAPKADKFLSGAFALVVFIEFMAAMAPLTASDALHYHFAVPALILQSGFHANFFLSHSFFCGQSHLLILLGLALGGERLAMALVFAGGILSAAATACLARRWVSRSWAWIISLIFLVTPLVFWQIASPGAPDLWMSFFTILAVLVISKAHEIGGTASAILAGCFAGAIAGAKYTGCFVAAALLVAFLVELRSLRKAGIFASAALVTGFWPYLRNIMWGGDPFFPFLLPQLSPEHVNNSALAWYIADTSSGVPKNILQLIEFVLFSRVDPGRLGFFQFFGPLVLAFSPLLFRTVRNTPLWRACLITWTIAATSIGLRAGMARFSLAVFPLALTAVIASIAALSNSRHKLLRVITFVSIALSLVAGLFGLLVYARKPITVSLGLISREEYLRQNSPDYQVDEFTNQFFETHHQDGNVLVFVRHVYHLKIPFLYSDPKSSWAIDPSKLQTPEQWQTFLAKNDIRWVVRNAGYPSAISKPLEELEKNGDLLPGGRTVVENFRGKRIQGVREYSEVVILQVRDKVNSEYSSPAPN